MTSIARNALKPIRKRVTKVRRRATRAARNTDRALSRAQHAAEAAVDDGWKIAKSVHARIEERPHTAFLTALLLGAVVGMFSRARR